MMSDRYWLVLFLMVVPFAAASCGGNNDDMAVCGDGVVEEDEECDDGNTSDGDGCSSECSLEAPPPGCGDGMVDATEECDDGNTSDGDGCSSVCTIEEPPVCGDGRRSATEACDDGNNVDGDGCSADCTIETPEPMEIAAAGDSITVLGTIDGTEFLWARPTEECEPEPDEEEQYFDVISIVNNTGEEQVLTITARWAAGDGYLHVFMDPFDPVDYATCVEGNDDLNDTDQSQIEEMDIGEGEILHIIASTYSEEDAIGDYIIEIRTTACGDGIVDGDEECDDGNNTDGDGCDAECALEAVMPIAPSSEPSRAARR